MWKKAERILGDAMAELMIEIPANIPAEIGLPSDELLKTLGAEFIGRPQGCRN